MSKLDKMKGVPRIAFRSFRWKDFLLRPGAAYGRDENGQLFVSFGTRADKFGIPEAKPRHIIVFRCINEDSPMPTKHRQTVWGANSVMIGRRPIIAEAGVYSSPWAYEWTYTQLSYDDPLAKAIHRTITAYHNR